MDVIQLRGVGKRIGQATVLADVDLSLGEGEFLGLVGSNGAGKSTLLRIVSGLLRPSAGTVLVMGSPPSDPKRLGAWLGVVHQHSGLPEYLTVREFADIETRTRRLDPARVGEVFDVLQVTPSLGKLIAHLSEGTRRRIVIAKALLHAPRILLLDEPTAGLDPVVQTELWRRLLDLKKTGVSALVATNDLREAEHLCDRVVFLRGGRIVGEHRVAGGALAATAMQLLEG